MSASKTRFSHPICTTENLMSDPGLTDYPRAAYVAGVRTSKGNLSCAMVSLTSSLCVSTRLDFMMRTTAACACTEAVSGKQNNALPTAQGDSYRVAATLERAFPGLIAFSFLYSGACECAVAST